MLSTTALSEVRHERRKRGACVADQQKTEAEKIQDRLRARVEDIRTRQDLSNDGRKRQLAKAHTEAADEMRKVRAADETTRAQREEKLLRTLFG